MMQKAISPPASEHYLSIIFKEILRIVKANVVEIADFTNTQYDAKGHPSTIVIIMSITFKAILDFKVITSNIGQVCWLTNIFLSILLPYKSRNFRM